MNFCSSFLRVLIVLYALSVEGVCMAEGFVIDRCEHKTKFTQICQIEGRIGFKGEEISVYSESTWVGAGIILNSNKSLTIIRIEETTTHVLPGFEVVNTSRANTIDLDPKIMFSKSDMY